MGRDRVPRRAAGAAAVALAVLGAASLTRTSGIAARSSATGVAAVAQSAPIAFEVPRVVDPIHTYGEPDIGIAPNQPPYVSAPSDATAGQVYVSGPTGTGTQRSIWEGSVDGGHTFRTIHRQPPLLPVDPCVTPAVCGPLSAPGGGDTEINFDHSGKQYFADLYALACQHTATRIVNPDGTETVNENDFNGGCPVPGSDRQWILVRDPALRYGPQGGATSSVPPVIYMETNTVAACGTNGGAGWYVSSDGLTYSSAVPGQPGGTANTFCPFGADGYPSIDQSTGDVLQAEFGSVNNKAAIQLNIGTPTSGGLCFLDGPTGGGCPATAPGLITVAQNSPALNDVVDDATTEAANFAVSSLDSGRNLWVAWVNHATDPKLHQTWVSVGTAASGWKQWSTPVRVSNPPSQVSIFPWIIAGDAGRADVVWYGDAVSATPSDTSVKHRWDVYMAQVVYPTVTSIAPGWQRGVDTTATPSLTQVKVTPHPMDYEDVCLLGTACVTAVGNRNLADFFEVRADNTGAAMIVYDDMSNGLCEQAFGCPQQQITDHAGAPVVTIARQSSGPGIYDDPATGLPIQATGPSNAPVTGMSSAAGSALVPVFGGKNVPQLDVLDSRLSTSGQTLTITTKLAGDPRLSSDAATAAGCSTCQVQYVTRWQMGTGLYYGMVENGPLTGLQYYAGASQTIDDCSVSACDPHVLTYPEAPPFGVSGHAEQGSVQCPPSPSPSNPCVLTETVSLADIGAPANGSLLEEVGSYSFTSTNLQSALTQLNERNDNGAREIDGLCCYNFQASAVVSPTPTPSAAPSATPTPGGGLSNTATVTANAALPSAGILLVVGALAARRHRRRMRRAASGGERRP